MDNFKYLTPLIENHRQSKHLFDNRGLCALFPVANVLPVQTAQATCTSQTFRRSSQGNRSPLETFIWVVPFNKFQGHGMCRNKYQRAVQPIALHISNPDRLLRVSATPL